MSQPDSIKPSAKAKSCSTCPNLLQNKRARFCESCLAQRAKKRASDRKAARLVDLQKQVDESDGTLKLSQTASGRLKLLSISCPQCGDEKDSFEDKLCSSCSPAKKRKALKEDLDEEIDTDVKPQKSKPKKKVDDKSWRISNIPDEQD